MPRIRGQIAVQAISRGEGRPRIRAAPPQADRLRRCERCHDDERERGTPPSPETRSCARFRPSHTLTLGGFGHERHDHLDRQIAEAAGDAHAWIRRTWTDWSFL